MIIHYQCPNCSGNMSYDATNGMLTCPSCQFEEAIEQHPEELISTEFEETDGKEYNCTNCSAVLITDADTVATNCSFCGSNIVLADRISGTLAPAKVIPFTISKEEAIEAFKKWCRNGLLTPKGFASEERLQSIVGIYVPFWLYDFKSDIHVRAKGNIVRTYTSGDYIITEKKVYDVERDLHLRYLKIPADASTKMNDELMDKLEPYVYGEMQDFNSAYLAGFIAEKYNLTDEELKPRVLNKIAPYIDENIKRSLNGYSTYSIKRKDIDTKTVKTYYTLLPVWMITEDYENEEFMFAMNGQTGKVVGKPPLSKKKVAAWFGGIAGGVLLVMKTISAVMGGGFL